MEFNEEDVYLNVWTDFSWFEIIATHLPTRTSISQRDEYLGDNWFRSKKEIISKLRDKINIMYKGRGKK